LFNINWTNKATKQLLKITTADRPRIVNAVNQLSAFPSVRQIKALSNHASDYRLRVGNYRVLFAVNTTVRIIQIDDVRKRDDNTYA